VSDADIWAKAGVISDPANITGIKRGFRTWDLPQGLCRKKLRMRVVGLHGLETSGVETEQPVDEAHLGAIYEWRDAIALVGSAEPGFWPLVGSSLSCLGQLRPDSAVTGQAGALKLEAP